MSHRILIIDDEDDIREVAALSLETVAGWDVAVASSGAQGLVRAAEYNPDPPPSASCGRIPSPRGFRCCS